MEIVGNTKEYKYTPISKKGYYRQRITLQKCDEDGKNFHRSLLDLQQRI